MLRVGLTGGLGAGKSTAARLFAEHGAVVLSSDAIGRELMQPGETVHAAIVARLGQGVVLPGGELDRRSLARLAFQQGRVEELNSIVHPAVIARQEELMRGLPSDAVVLIESALLFETKHGRTDSPRNRFDRLILVTAPEALKITRFLERSVATEETRAPLEAEARRRLATQMPDAAKVLACDYVLTNDGELSSLKEQVDHVWRELSAIRHPAQSPETTRG